MLLRRTLLLAPLGLVGLSGCTASETWAAVEAERRRIATELVKERVVADDKQDAMKTIVFNRPRTKPESILTGYEPFTLMGWHSFLELLQALLQYLSGAICRMTRPDIDRIMVELDEPERLGMTSMRHIWLEQGNAEGKAEGKAEGEAKGLRMAVVGVLAARFPELAKESGEIADWTDPEALHAAHDGLLRARTKTDARRLLRELAPK